jgi:hypothetical protein
MAQFMFLLYDDESWYDEVTPETFAEAMQLHGAFSAAVEAAGAKVLGGEALERSSTGTTVHNATDGPDGAAATVTDGPFVETKEALGGFYLIEATDLDAAIELAKQCPSGHVEVRPVMDTSGG